MESSLCLGNTGVKQLKCNLASVGGLRGVWLFGGLLPWPALVCGCFDWTKIKIKIKK